MNKLIFYILLIISFNVSSQTLTIEQVKADIDTAISVLSSIHPTFNQSHNKLEIINLRDTIKHPVTAHEFFKVIQPLICVDGHTTLQYNARIYPEIPSPLLPFETIFFDNRLYVKNNLSADTLIVRGTEILAINNTKANDIINNLLPYVPGEKIEHKIRKLDNAGFANWYRLVYGNFDTFKISYQNENAIRSISVRGINWNDFTGDKKQAFDFKILDGNIGYLKVGKFRHPGKFMTFIDSVFYELSKQQITSLIIDKTSGGGISNLVDSLMSFITDKPYRELEKKLIRISSETHEFISELKNMGDTVGEYFVIKKEPVRPVNRENRFKGNIYVLAGPNSYSAATMFVAMVKCYTGHTIIGQETGQPLISNADLSRHRLPNTGLNLYTSHSIYYLPCARNRQDGVKPDIEVKMTLDDLLNDNDKYLEFTLDLIKRKTN
jgi:C-terminal processing protease CtpA/Prc